MRDLKHFSNGSQQAVFLPRQLISVTAVNMLFVADIKDSPTYLLCVCVCAHTFRPLECIAFECDFFSVIHRVRKNMTAGHAGAK